MLLLNINLFVTPKTADSWDYFMYNGRTGDCSQVDVDSCIICDANETQQTSFTIMYSGIPEGVPGFTNCSTYTYLSSSNCTGRNSTREITNASYLQQNDCNYLKHVEVPVDKCLVAGQETGFPYALFIFVASSVCVLVGIIVCIIIWVFQQKRKAARRRLILIANDMRLKSHNVNE